MKQENNNILNDVLTLEKNLNDDSLFYLQNKELEPFYQKTPFVYSDVFFNLSHAKTSFFLNSYFKI